MPADHGNSADFWLFSFQPGLLFGQKGNNHTYPFSDPDPIPVFARSSLWGAGAKIYPYFVFNGFSQESSQQEWTVVRLKNKYLEVSILPEVGGKVWGAKDLKTGREFIYTNHVLKFREIALRGPDLRRNRV
jgi:hypothetical protein